MKQTFNTVINGVGVMFILVGFCVFVGAGGNADLGADMATEIMPFLIKGMILLFGGIFLASWKC